MHTAVDRFLGRYPTARLGLAAVASIVVLADLIVLVQVAGPTAVDSTANVPTVTVPTPAAPASTAPAPPTGGPAEATQVPPMLVPPQRTAAPTAAPAPAQAQTRGRPAPATTVRPRRSTLPEPTQEGRGHRSPFEQRCRDGEIEPWLCHGLPN
jgi:hypothetical protein